VRLWFHKVSRDGKSGLVADDEDGRALLRRMGDGECIQVEATRLRSVQFNKLYWSICREIGENQDPKRDEDSIDAELRILAGHYELMYFAGREVRVPKRIAFDKMGADDWNDYFKRAEIAIAERFGSEYVRELAA
jgi:hypothetical protein